jgi:hypothetical protein
MAHTTIGFGVLFRTSGKGEKGRAYLGACRQRSVGDDFAGVPTLAQSSPPARRHRQEREYRDTTGRRPERGEGERDRLTSDGSGPVDPQSNARPPHGTSSAARASCSDPFFSARANLMEEIAAARRSKPIAGSRRGVECFGLDS